jgi:hypothetical protein
MKKVIPIVGIPCSAHRIPVKSNSLKIWGSMNLAVDFRQLPKVISPRTLKMGSHWNWTFGNCRKSTAKVCAAKFMFPKI